MEEPSGTQNSPAAGSDAKYLLVVCGLLMAIVILLTVLWLRERRAVNGLQAELLKAQQQRHRIDLNSQLGQMLAAKVENHLGGALNRAELPTQTVTWNGQPRTVMMVAASAGRRIGLEPGDVLAVSAAPATSPAAGSATSPEAGPATTPAP